jgi:1,4-alpha-glucan branching enzyme
MTPINKPVSSNPKPSNPTALEPTTGLSRTASTRPTQTARRPVRFELEISKARSVSVVGTFNDWKLGITPLSCLGGAKWAREVPLAPGRHEYRFVVDGQWMDDPKARTHAPNPYGGRNAVLEVRA